nr:hypothetical protein [Tanacetum cinerariifolium]
MVAIDGVGFDWSYMAKDEVPTNMTLMAFLDSKPEFEGYGPKTSKSVSKDISNEVKESPDALLVKQLVSNDKLEKKTVFPTVTKIEFVRPKQQKNQLGNQLNMLRCTCHKAGCNYHQRERVVTGNNYTRVNYNNSTRKTYPSAHRNMASRSVLMKNSLRPFNTARLVNTTHLKNTVYSARPMSCFSKSAQSTVKRPYQQRRTLNNKSFNQKVNTTRPKAVNTARLKVVNTARPCPAVVITELVEVSTKKDEAETAQESSSKRAGDELDQERSKKQKVEDDKESKELKKCLKIIPYDGDKVTINATCNAPLRKEDVMS